MKSNKLLILPVVLTTITLLSGIILSSTLTHADGNTDVVDELDVTVNSACTMKGGPNGTDDSGSSTYTTTINAGNYTELPGSKLVTLCNDPAGYAIYAIGYSGDSYDSQTHTDLIGTATTGNIQTGTSGNDSYWAMKLEAVEGLTPPSIVTDFQNYHVIPDTYTKVASYTTPTATASDAGATVQTKYKINISKTQLAGAYNGKVKYTMVHPNTAPAPIVPVETSCETTPVPNLTYMQDLNSSNKASILAGMQEDSQYYLKDKRDEKKYCVAKLRDGNIWMTQNLDHDIVTDGSVIYNSTTTDLPANTTWTPDKATYATNNTTWHDDETGQTIQESYDPGNLNMNKEYLIGMNYYNICADNSSCDSTIYTELSADWKSFFDSCDTGTISNCDYSLMPNNPTVSVSIGPKQYHIGNYYNWTAAIATNDSSSYTTQYQDVDQSICPANWTLPKAGNNAPNGSIEYLLNQYGWNTSTFMLDGYISYEHPFYFTLDGIWTGTATYFGSDGYYWSKTVRNSGNAYLYGAFGYGTVGSGPYYSMIREYGYSLRCLSR